MTAEEYAAYANHIHTTIGEDDEKSFEEYIEDAFNAGKEEQKQQMMKEAVEVDVIGHRTGWLSFGYVSESEQDFNEGDKVLVIILKKEE